MCRELYGLVFYIVLRLCLKDCTFELMIEIGKGCVDDE